MPIIRPSSDLRNSYNEISNICHQTNKPIYITKNGAGDLAVMSIELYESLAEKYENYTRLESRTEVSPQFREAEAKVIKTTNLDKEENIGKPVYEAVIQRNTDIGMNNNYANKDNKAIKKEHINGGNKDNKLINNNEGNENKEKTHLKDNVFKKIDASIDVEERVEPESAHEILQEIEIEPIIQSKTKEKLDTTKQGFRSLKIDANNTQEKKHANIAKEVLEKPQINKKSTKVKDINNTDWIFEDLNKMLNDIKV